MRGRTETRKQANKTERRKKRAEANARRKDKAKAI